MKSYGLPAAIGFLLGVMVVFWVRPETNAGAVFIVVTATIFCFVIGAALDFVLGLLKRN